MCHVKLSACVSSAAVLFSRRSGGYRAAASLVSASPSTAPLQFRINTGTENYTHSVQQIRQKGITIPSMKKTEKDENLFLGSCPASRGVQYPAVVTVLLPNDFKLAKNIYLCTSARNKRALLVFAFIIRLLEVRRWPAAQSPLPKRYYSDWAKTGGSLASDRPLSGNDATSCSQLVGGN